MLGVLYDTEQWNPQPGGPKVQCGGPNVMVGDVKYMGEVNVKRTTNLHWNPPVKDWGCHCTRDFGTPNFGVLM